MAVKKVTKRVAKKTYPKKKTPPKPRVLTLDEYMTITAEEHAKTEAAIRELSVQNKKTAMTLQETLRSVDRMSDNVDKMSDRVDKMSDRLDKTSDRVDILSENIGGVNNRLGVVVELIIVPKLRHNMNAQGHNFDLSEPDKRIRGVIAGRRENIAQVDMLLHGPTEAMAVEVKTRLKESSVRDHLERLQDLRDHEDEAGIKGKKLFGAVVGVTIDDFARKIAKENGLYIVKIHEAEGELDIEKPESCHTW